jgi:hypothetical protein
VGGGCANQIVGECRGGGLLSPCRQLFFKGLHAVARLRQWIRHAAAFCVSPICLVLAGSIANLRPVLL